ncbi:flagellar basal body rod protein FlgC [Bradyrhizobium sp.]|uniref:flagellar basal body rod protein FlgC n=1 Tax=Bradyrhizobium sp. TaxID=376 RepID=UPI002D23BE6D|nr:flagellar basal body protein [Bradyrhizobium sp.]HZR76368.1 flagellar basal body protein [Bradyrhizobium sp.]
MSTLSIATSGLSAASLRLDVTASNLANALTTGPLPASDGSNASGNAGSSNSSSNFSAYVPLQVNQVDQSSGSAPGGTAAVVSTVSPSFVPQFDPTSPFANQDGLIAAPNVDLASQFIQLLTAKYDFAANAKVIQAYDNTQKSLLDITA